MTTKRLPDTTHYLRPVGDITIDYRDDAGTFVMVIPSGGGVSPHAVHLSLSQLQALMNTSAMTYQTNRVKVQKYHKA